MWHLRPLAGIQYNFEHPSRGCRFGQALCPMCPDPEIPDARASGFIFPIPAKSGFPISRIRDSGQIGIPDFPNPVPRFLANRDSRFPESRRIRDSGQIGIQIRENPKFLSCAIVPDSGRGLRTVTGVTVRSWTLPWPRHCGNGSSWTRRGAENPQTPASRSARRRSWMVPLQRPWPAGPGFNLKAPSLAWAPSQ